ncbi:helix-turn-helix domain-containing protein [Rhodococcus sp. HNM0569]|uniref:PucR family transcriptional regulator n=1 Tax=Rhodococcus sp. HNM0569 TaxID=2716340 RepID=UPI00146BD78D|nr:helix-turn-helix domain-containing protein [Rhodococcus sp. HNM0569]NLU84379.1 PucR family transcriptional regulator [Rhodococcus sp. HNM0569]
MDVTHYTSPDPAPDSDHDELRRGIARAWAALVDQADAVADDITRRLIERDKEWHETVGPEFRAELRHNTREHVRRGVRTMAGLSSDGETTSLWRETGRRRARQGVPLELVLNAYTIGTRVMWEALLTQQATLGIDDRVLVHAGRRIWSNLDVQNSVMSAAYRKEAALMQRRDLHLQGRLLDGLVEGRGADPQFAAEVQEVLGVGADDPIACVVAPFDGHRDSPLRAPDDRLDDADIASYWQVRGDLHFGLVVLIGTTLDDLVCHLRPCATGRVGIAGAPEGISGFGTAFQLAGRTVDTIARGSVDVAVVDDRLPQVLLASSPAATGLLVRRTLGPVLAMPRHQSDVLLGTLRALLAHNGSPTHAAESLYCHRNTVIYRMRQVKELTGRSIADPDDRLLLSLALMGLDV